MENDAICSIEQEANIKYLEERGFHIVIWEHDQVCMLDKNGKNPIEVFSDGSLSRKMS